MKRAFLIASIVAAVSAAGCGSRATLEDDCAGLKTGGVDSCRMTLKRPWWARGDVRWKIREERTEAGMNGNCLSATVDQKTLFLETTQTPCAAMVEAHWIGHTWRRIVRVEQNVDDTDGDGFPDVTEMSDAEDRAAFRAWFTGIALSQAENASEWWTPENRDCAGLVRFAYREALRKHSRLTMRRYPGLTSPAHDVGKYNYPAVPILESRIFRTAEGSFSPSDVREGRFSDFATARYLQEFNTKRVSRNLADALPGDMLFFHHTDDTRMPYHTMIVVKTNSNETFLLYHTGPVHGTKGRLKLVTVEALMAFPDFRWRPVAENENFLGVYRFRILDGTEVNP